MNREDIIRMAREADGHAYTNRHMKDEPAFAFSIDRLERFANAAYAAGASAEREQCAMVCEARSDKIMAMKPIRMTHRHFSQSALECAELIRARGNGGEK